MRKDILNEVNIICEEEGIGENESISIVDMIKKIIDKRVTQFKSNGGEVDDNSLENIIDEFASDLFETPLEEIKAMRERHEKKELEIIDNMKRIY